MYEYHLSLEKRYIYTFGYLDVFATNNPRSVSEKPLWRHSNNHFNYEVK